MRVNGCVSVCVCARVTFGFCVVSSCCNLKAWANQKVKPHLYFAWQCGAMNMLYKYVDI